MLKATLIFVLAAATGALPAKEARKADRQEILDTVRPQASKLAGQSVRIKVDRLNVDSGWAVLVGEIVSTSGKGINWELADSCHPDLDKMLWVVLQKSSSTWQVKQLDICASEPPYWYLNQREGLIWPCGVYAGLEDGGEESLEARCRAKNPRRR